MIFTLVCTSSLNADIYVWIDENGVKNFTNLSPPEGAVLFIKDSEASRITTEDKPLPGADTHQRQPDATGEALRLREELEELKKLLAKSREASTAAAEGPDPNQSSSGSGEDVYDSSDEAYPEAYAYPSYTVYEYYYPYFGYGKFGYGYAGKRYYHKRYHPRKRHYGYHKKDHNYQHRHGKHYKKNLSSHRHNIHHRGKHPNGYQTNLGQKGRHHQNHKLSYHHLAKPYLRSHRRNYLTGTHHRKPYAGFRARYYQHR
jgi:hypothetical protein